MQRAAILALCAAVALATVWLLVRAGEPRGGAERAAGVTAESPERSAGSLAAADGPTGEQAGGESSAGAPSRAGTFAPQSGVARSAAGGEPAGASDSGSTAAGSEGQATGQQSEAGASAAEPITPQDAARWAAKQPPADANASPDVPPDERPPTDSNAKATTGEPLSVEQAREQAEAEIPKDLPPEQREPLVKLRTDEIFENSGKAGGWQGPVNTP